MEKQERKNKQEKTLSKEETASAKKGGTSETKH